MVIEMSRILIKEDGSLTTSLVEYWISAKGNLCWKHNGKVYVKLRSNFTMMTLENQSNWVPADCHTQAKAVEVAMMSKPQSDQAPLNFV